MKNSSTQSTPSRHPFGMIMSERSFSSEKYRYSFNGKEVETSSFSGGISFETRIYDSRLGRFLSCDLLEYNYPWLSTYAFAANNPIFQIDYLGMGPDPAIIGKAQGPTQLLKENGHSATDAKGYLALLDALVYANPSKFSNYDFAANDADRWKYWNNSANYSWNEGEKVNMPCNAMSDDTRKTFAFVLNAARSYTPASNLENTNYGKFLNSLATQVDQDMSMSCYKELPASGAMERLYPEAFFMVGSSGVLVAKGAFAIFSKAAARGVGGLLKAGNTLDKGGFTSVGRALQKHGSRTGSTFPKATGDAAAINAQGEAVLNGILTNPNATNAIRHHARFGNVLEYRIPGGQGARFSGNGKTFIGFLE